MPIALTEDHRALADVVRSFAAGSRLRAAARAALDAPAGEVPAFWKELVDLGWTGLHLPEQHGGAGAGLPELAVVVEGLGAAVAPGPFLTSAIGSAVIDLCGGDALRARLLPALAGGGATAAFAAAPAVTRDGDVLRGTASVAGGVSADHIVLAVGGDLVVVAGADTARVATDGAVDPGLAVAVVSVDGVRGETIPGAAAQGLAVARALAAAEAAGGAAATLAMALDYAKVREQFGRIIGSFQAVKHHLANMLIAAERAVAVAWDAARAAGRGDDQAQLAGAVAAAVALEAYVKNAQMNIQVHGGIGFTWEHDAHLYLRRAVALQALFGDGAVADVHRLSLAGVRRDHAVALPPEAESFRAQARETVARLAAAGDDAERRRLLVESGYLVPHWPAPFGRGAGPVEQLVIEEEFAGVAVPNLGIGGWVLLTLVQQASPEQVERWALPSLHGELTWCQLFSEPGAGSDAAAVQTRAERVEGGWRITGQKVWTSNAQFCNRGLATVRTNPDAPKHKGITTMAVDLNAPGVTVRPLRELTGDALFNEVFFDDVFVPDADVVGAVDDGWTVARATLGNERVSIGGGTSMGSRAVDVLDAVETARGGDPALRLELGRLIAAEQAMQMMNLRHIERAVVGGGPGVEGNITKLLTAEQLQAVSEFALRVHGAAAVDGGRANVAKEYLLNRCMTIAGGTSEISRNVIAERMLGLPREAMGR